MKAGELKVILQIDAIDFTETLYRTYGRVHSFMVPEFKGLIEEHELTCHANHSSECKFYQDLSAVERKEITKKEFFKRYKKAEITAH